MVRQWKPLLQGLKSYVKPDGVGYIDIMQHFLTDTNEALETRNARLLQLLSKVSADLYEKQLPYIQNIELRALYVKAVKGNRQLEQQLKQEKFNLHSLNKFIAMAANSLNNFLNSH